MKTLKLKDDFYWTGINNPELKVFDIVMATEFGTTYNSYILIGSEKTVLFETAWDKRYDEFLDKITSITPVEKIDYIVLDHTEPDHSGAIEKLLKINPGLKLVGSAAAIGFLKEICNIDFNSVVVKNGDVLSLGNKTLRFITAPNLHWPDSIYTYIEEDKTLISCDSFGTHFAGDYVLNDLIPNEEDYWNSVKYYFDHIMAPFKKYVLEAVEKISELEIDMICPGHGPVLKHDPWKVVELYKEWATEINPNTKKTVVISYVSAYGYTKIITEKIAEGIKSSGDITLKIYDMQKTSNEEALGEIYWADGILFGTPTIVGEALKPIWDLTTSMFARIYGGKIASAFGSYGWSGEGVPHIIERLKQLNMKVYKEGLRIKFKPSEAQLQEAYEFGYNFGKSVLQGKIVEPEIVPSGEKTWKCLVCGEIVKGIFAPEACPVCGVGPEQFVQINEAEISFKSTSADKIIIIGNGVAGISACEAIRKRNTNCEVEIISSENVIGYSRPMLTKGLLSDLDPVNFYIKSLAWYDQQGIKLTLNTVVEAINPSEKTITIAGGHKKSFDKLILATGAEGNIPPIKGAELKGVFSIRKLSDVNNIQEWLPSVKKIIVIGGGVLGLEAAWEFKKSGRDVTVLEMGPGLMVNQLDSKASRLLQDSAERSGIKVITGAKIDCIYGNSIVGGVRLEDGTEYPGELVSISAGIKPNAAIGASAGLDAGRWINVNEFMETSVEGIYACGDVAMCNGVSFAIWNQGLEMGKVAGANAVGDKTAYSPVIPSNTFHGLGTALFSIGDNGKKPEIKYKELELTDDGQYLYKKLYFVNDRFCGGILIGDVSKSGKMMKGYEKGLSMKEMIEIL